MFLKMLKFLFSSLLFSSFTIFPCLYFLFYRLEIKLFSLPFYFGNVYEHRIHEEPLYLPELFAMHVAVSILSPVNIQTRTPALRRSSRDSRTLNWSLETRIINNLKNWQFNTMSKWNRNWKLSFKFIQFGSFNLFVVLHHT